MFIYGFGVGVIMGAKSFVNGLLVRLGIRDYGPPVNGSIINNIPANKRSVLDDVIRLVENSKGDVYEFIGGDAGALNVVVNDYFSLLMGKSEYDNSEMEDVLSDNLGKEVEGSDLTMGVPVEVKRKLIHSILTYELAKRAMPGNAKLAMITAYYARDPLLIDRDIMKLVVKAEYLMNISERTGFKGANPETVLKAYAKLGYPENVDDTLRGVFEHYREIVAKPVPNTDTLIGT
jgi:hypothetical protein